jgi:DNA-directed RNA polymerase specialized sigma24 family protein
VTVSGDLWGPATNWSLIERARGRDGIDARVEAWRALVDRYTHPISVGLRRRLPSHLVEDGASTFLSYLFEKGLLERLDPERGRFRAFVQGVMRRWVKSYLRYEHRGQGVPLEDVGPVVVGGGRDPELERHEEDDWASQVLRHGLERLEQTTPDDARLLRAAYGLPPDESQVRDGLARAEGLTVNALNIRLHRARGRLRAAIDEELRALCSTEEAWEEERQLLIGRLLEAHPRLLDDAGHA